MRILLTLTVWFGLLLASAASAQSLEDLARQLPEGSFNDRAEVVAKIGATGDDRAVGLLNALGEGELRVREADGAVIQVKGRGSKAVGYDPLTGDELGPVGSGSTESIRVNNSLRRAVRAAIGLLTLSSPDAGKRLAAANTAFAAPDPEQIEALDTAIAKEGDAAVRTAMEQARAAAVLASDAPGAEKVAAIGIVARRGGTDALTVLNPYRGDADAPVAEAADKAIAGIERAQQLWNVGQNVWFGLSLGSVLLLAAVGLAITFGVMGVINMAHGELIMIGAYTTYVTQQVIRTSFPGLFDWSLLIAAPLAFLVAGAIGVAIERFIVRFLYGRALETLLATWGVSLILQQLVRTFFGPSNREVGNPSWMSGAFPLGGLSITWNRFYIVIFAVAIFVGLLLLLKRTLFGLQMRAVTQNRPMASEMGIRTARVDALTFGLGAGIAGLAGVALSQIDNVSPNLGQSYIIDSFLVVVFGGAGNLWGTFAAAFTLGVANKFMEPFVGAVLAKILILVFIILFIQKRPRGLFPTRGRAVEG
ncbi:urea ABC transporter permease subunit UrtB [Amaricoccus solimangrovi]|uniref:Urea ABC transporter permease subunit UrtB n=1 Tax=Amaricoccus solimangrovi TaxID=2589815 RepID=A0A501WY40_9RHOB|nr:urea ABC transporter permease subunit UrtB [Amaricoccus solimangrovi]TPE53175.1 urea ABC transporter permease subunit UrtB [Amaricoccus solimangrovi]